MIVFGGRPPKIAKWKSLVLTGAIVGTIASPLIALVNVYPYQGGVPPQVPLVRALGTVVFSIEKQGIKSISVADFISDEGVRFRLQDSPVLIPEIGKWNSQYGSRAPIYVEGFNLRDGDGLFWIDYAAGINGQVILSRDYQHERLSRNRNSFNRLLHFLYLYTVAPLWLVAFFTIRKARISLGT